MHRLIGFAVAVAVALTAQTAFAHDDDSRKGHNKRATPITTCGTEITKPGDYYLANDLIGCTGHGIEIRSSRVDLDLRGHTIVTTLVRNGFGIKISGGASGVHSLSISGPGLVHGFNAGIDIQNMRFSEIQGVTVTGNIHGITVNRFFDPGPVFGTESRFNVFRRNKSVSNFGHGITSNGGNHNLYEGNFLAGNEGFGLFLFDAVGNKARRNVANRNISGIVTQGGIGLDNVIRENTAFGNSSFDLRDENGNCDNNEWQDNTFFASNVACIE